MVNPSRVLVNVVKFGQQANAGIINDGDQAKVCTDVYR